MATKTTHGGNQKNDRTEIVFNVLLEKLRSADAQGLLHDAKRLEGDLSKSKLLTKDPQYWEVTASILESYEFLGAPAPLGLISKGEREYERIREGLAHNKIGVTNPPLLYARLRYCAYYFQS